jgi:hypothetical protein
MGVAMIGRVLVIGGCCCAIGGGAWYYWPNPNPNPNPPIVISTTTLPYVPSTTVTLPAPTAGVAGPIVGTPNAYSPDAAGQLPKLSDEVSVDGADALGYVADVRRLIPGTNWYFAIADQMLNCAITDGLLAARAYFGGTATATVVFVVASPAGYTLSQAAYDCATKKLEEPLGGPSEFQPCADAYWYDVGSVRYFVFVASTQATGCSTVEATHQQRYVTNQIWSYR